MSDLLRIEDLHVRFSNDDGRVVHALNGVSLRVREREVVGILGESGSGKSTLAKALLKLLGRNSMVTGNVLFEGKNFAQLPEREMNAIRGARIALVPQEPGVALNPVMKVGDQVAEVLRAHRNWDRHRCHTEAARLLERVHLRVDGRNFYDAYPHQLSGGQQQRVVIAQAVACGPALIIADEATASLDSATELQILDLFRELKAEQKNSILFITHNPALLQGLADRVAVMYAGRIVEESFASQIFEEAKHPYTKALLECVPGVNDGRQPGYRLHTIEGAPPDPERLAAGCSFSPRCSRRLEKCDNLRPGVWGAEDGSRVECFLYER